MLIKLLFQRGDQVSFDTDDLLDLFLLLGHQRFLLLKGGLLRLHQRIFFVEFLLLAGDERFLRQFR